MNLNLLQEPTLPTAKADTAIAVVEKDHGGATGIGEVGGRCEPPPAETGPGRNGNASHDPGPTLVPITIVEADADVQSQIVAEFEEAIDLLNQLDLGPEALNAKTIRQCVSAIIGQPRYLWLAPTGGLLSEYDGTHDLLDVMTHRFDPEACLRDKLCRFLREQIMPGRYSGER